MVEDLSLKRKSWSREHLITAVACFAAWMIEVIAPAGASVRERHGLLRITLERFAGKRRDALKWIRPVLRTKSKALLPLRMIRNRLRSNEKLRATLQAPHFYWGLNNMSGLERAFLLQQIFERLKNGGRFDPRMHEHKLGDIEFEILFGLSDF